MRKKLAIVVAAALAAETFMLGTAAVNAAPMRPVQTYQPAPAEAQVEQVQFHRRHWRGRRGGGDGAAAAIIGGLAAGAIIGMAARPRYYDDYYDGYDYDPGPRYILPRRAPSRAYYGGGLDAHQQWCLNRWRSYDVGSDTYQPSRGDRRYCNSPYN